MISREKKMVMLMEYFGVKKEIIDYWLESIEERVSTSWKYWTRNGQSVENNLNFNSEIQYQPACVCSNYINAFCSDLYQDIWNEIKDEHPKKLLDYGCGTADFSLDFAIKDKTEITIAEFEGLMLNFVKYVFANIPLKVKYPLDYNIYNQYDMIICLDNLEHLFNPMEVLKFLTDSLETGGLLILKVTIMEGNGHCISGMNEIMRDGEAFLASNYIQIGTYKFKKK